MLLNIQKFLLYDVKINYNGTKLKLPHLMGFLRTSLAIAKGLVVCDSYNHGLHQFTVYDTKIYI